MLSTRLLKGAALLAAAPKLLQRVWQDTAPFEECVVAPAAVDINLDNLESQPSVHWVRLALTDPSEAAWLTQPGVARLSPEEQARLFAE